MANSTLTAGSGPLIDRLWAVGERKLLRQVILAVAGVALLTLSTKVQVPFYPVPMTLQTMVVLLIGAAYGWRLGTVTVGLYLLQGLAGLPVFANSAMAGPAYFLGPTAGFLVAFIASAAITGFAVEKGAARSLPLLAGAMLLAQAVVFTIGTIWLAQFAQLSNGTTGVGFARAWALVQTFLPGDLLKAAIAVALVTVFARKTRG
jgi:biotin transport system substrate-specific component